MECQINSTPLHQFQVPSGEIFSIRWNNSNTSISIGTTNSQALIYNEEFEIEETFTCQTGAHKMPVSCIRFCPSHPELEKKPLALFTSTDGGMIHWNLLRKKFASFKRLSDDEIYSGDYSNEGFQYLLGCKEGTIKLFDHQTFTQITAFNSISNSQGARKVFCIKWIDDHLFLTGGWNDKITIWDNRTPVPAREMIGPHICGDSIDIKDNIVISASYKDKDQLSTWEWIHGSLINTFSLNSESKKLLPYCAQILPSNKKIAVVAGVGTEEVLLIDIENGQRLGAIPDIPSCVFTMHISTNDKIAIGTGKKALIYDLKLF